MWYSEEQNYLHKEVPTHPMSNIQYPQVSEILDILQSTNDIDNKVAADVKQFLEENQMVLTN